MAAAAIALLLLVGLGWVMVGCLQRALMFPGSRATAPPGTVEAAGGRAAWLDHEGGRTEVWLLPARGAASGTVLVYAHGNGELVDHWADAWEPLRAAGVAVLLVEYPGYGRSEGRPSAASIGAAMRAAWDWVAAQSGIDAKRIVGHGRSLGGGAVCALSRERPLAALILESTFTSPNDIARDMGFPGFVVRERFESRAAVERFAGPILIAHGEADAVIGVAHAKALHAAAPHSELMLLPCGHNDCPRPALRVLDFLRRSGLAGG
jgi:uncharacterized protein